MLKTNKISNFHQAEEYLLSFIPQSNLMLYPGDFGLQRTKYLMSLLGEPQEKMKTIHIAGTSGKGSTAYLTGLILHALGFSVGLIIKPHIHDIRERYQINNSLISEKDFITYINTLTPAVRKVESSEYGKPTYAEINTALAYLIFADKKVDYSVIETYMGGLYDCTNVIKREDKLVIITKLGLDHTKILGNTLREIAIQKTGVIYKGNQVFSLTQKPSAMSIIQQVAKQNYSELFVITPGETFQNVYQDNNGVVFDFYFKDISMKQVFLRLFGLYQAENATLALAAVSYLSKRDLFNFDETLIRKVMGKAYFPGRGEVINLGKKIAIVDGAHNPQKMEAFLDSVQKKYPDKKFTFLIAFVMGKDVKRMLQFIQPLAKTIITTSFFVEHQDWIKKAIDPGEVRDLLKKKQFTNCVAVNNKKEALIVALEKTDDILIITGSLYLAGELYSEIMKLKNSV